MLVSFWLWIGVAAARAREESSVPARKPRPLGFFQVLPGGNLVERVSPRVGTTFENGDLATHSALLSFPIALSAWLRQSEGAFLSHSGWHDRRHSPRARAGSGRHFELGKDGSIFTGEFLAWRARSSVLNS